MRRPLVLIYSLLLCLVILFVTESKGNAVLSHSLETIQPPDSYERLISVPDTKIALFAKKEEYDYDGFALQTADTYYSYPDWKNVINPAYAPKLFFEDINRDGKKEITIVLTTGYGTGILEQKVHVLHEGAYTEGKPPHKNYYEVLVDNPLAIVLKNVETKLSTHRAEFTIHGHTTRVDITPMKIDPGNLFPDINFGNIVKFVLENHELTATVGAQISPVAFIGGIKIHYSFKSKMYPAKRIEFISISNL